jgi:DNA repair exonuclease SbcCD nuclease subunit
VRRLSDRKPETILREKLGVAIHGQGFAERRMPSDLSAAYPAALPGLFNLGVLHTSATGRPGHEVYAPCTVEGLTAKRYDYWALGHVHTREVLCREPWIVFPGNIQGRHIREPGAKGCTLVTVENGAVTAVAHRDCDVLRWSVCEVEAGGAVDEEGVIERILSALRAEVEREGGLPLALRVRITGPCEAHPKLCAEAEKWMAEVRSLANEVGEIWIEKIRLETSHQRDLEAVLRRNDPMARLIQTIHELEDSPALLDAFLPKLETLHRRLPAELVPGGQLALLSDEARRRRCVEEVRQIMLPRLLAMMEAE